MKRYIIIICLFLLSLLNISCTSKNISTSAKDDYNLNKEIEFKKYISKDEMLKTIDNAINAIIENEGYQASILVNCVDEYGHKYDEKIEEIFYFELVDGEEIDYGYILKENIDDDKETVEYFCYENIVYYYNKTKNHKYIRDESYFSYYLEIDIYELLEDLKSSMMGEKPTIGYTDEFDEYGIDEYGNTLLITYCKYNDKLYEMRLVFKDNKLIHYAYNWGRDNTYVDVSYKKKRDIKINYPDFSEFKK